jgi:Flp pilus assembly CpaF family ATPase
MPFAESTCSLSCYRVAEKVLDHLMSPICDVLSDPSVTEIMMNAPDQIWIEKGGQLTRLSARLPDRGVTAAVRLLATLSETVSLEKDGTLEGHWRGWRVTAVLPPVSRDTPCLCLRRHRAEVLDLSQWAMRLSFNDKSSDAPKQSMGSNSLQSSACHGFHSILNQAHGVLISGSTGSGKTTFLGSLMAQIPDSPRVISLEDTPELPIACSHQLRLVARRGHSLRSLVRLALRLRPDRIVIGEVRGAEAFDMLQAMSTGHAACMGTIHAASALGALSRMEQLILTAGLDWPIEAIRSQLAEWIRVLVHLSRDVGGRFIREALWVEGVENGKYRVSPLYLS